ncbi:hypothetical protein CW304_33090 [Bacillus sp. UFRGS-B20]|nr:hypothetical protein CW304_33090 [Bacillus sp. UFRGS-B20]
MSCTKHPMKTPLIYNRSSPRSKGGDVRRRPLTACATRTPGAPASKTFATMEITTGFATRAGDINASGEMARIQMSIWHQEL